MSIEKKRKRIQEIKDQIESLKTEYFLLSLKSSTFNELINLMEEKGKKCLNENEIMSLSNETIADIESNRNLLN